MSAEDREIRRRLFWSAYTWDKVRLESDRRERGASVVFFFRLLILSQIISLALGRTPTFNAWQNVSPGPIVDDSEDDTEWRPYFWDDRVPPEMINYPVQKSLTTLNFRYFIKLCEIIQKIIMRLYHGRPSRVRDTRFVEEMRQKLEQWMAQLPEGIKMDADNLPEHCPPPHIFSTK